jgi:hypothetical protein
MEWREVRSSETGELLFRFWPERMLIEVMRRRADARGAHPGREVVRLEDYMLSQRSAGVDFAHIEGVDIEAEPV